MGKAIVFTFLVWVSAASAQTLFVQSVKAELRTSASNSAASLATLARGTQVQQRATEGAWTQVEVGGKTGWCLKLFLSSHKPIGKADLAKELEPSVEKASRRRTSSYGTAAAARGLMSDERTREGRERYRSDYQALERMDTLAITDDSLNRFHRGGKLKGE